MEKEKENEFFFSFLRSNHLAAVNYPCNVQSRVELLPSDEKRTLEIGPSFKYSQFSHGDTKPFGVSLHSYQKYVRFICILCCVVCTRCAYCFCGSLLHRSHHNRRAMHESMCYRQPFHEYERNKCTLGQSRKNGKSGRANVKRCREYGVLQQALPLKMWKMLVRTSHWKPSFRFPKSASQQNNHSECTIRVCWRYGNSKLFCKICTLMPKTGIECTRSVAHALIRPSDCRL